MLLVILSCLQKTEPIDFGFQSCFNKGDSPYFKAYTIPLILESPLLILQQKSSVSEHKWPGLAKSDTDSTHCKVAMLWPSQ